MCLPLKTRSSAIAGFAFFCRLEKICAGRNFLMGARALGERFNCKKIFAFFFENSGLNVGGKVDFSFEFFI